MDNGSLAIRIGRIKQDAGRSLQRFTQDRVVARLRADRGPFLGLGGIPANVVMYNGQPVTYGGQYVTYGA